MAPNVPPAEPGAIKLGEAAEPCLLSLCLSVRHPQLGGGCGGSLPSQDPPRPRRGCLVSSDVPSVPGTPPCPRGSWGAHSGHPLPHPLWVPLGPPLTLPREVWGGHTTLQPGVWGGGGISTRWQSHPVTFGKLLFTVTRGKWCRKFSPPFFPPQRGLLFAGGGGRGLRATQTPILPPSLSSGTSVTVQ